MVGGDGKAYEGLGYNVGRHTFRNESICISFIGDFNKNVAPDRQFLAAQRFIADGVNENKIQPDYKLYGQLQVNGYDSPGIFVYEVIKTWKHWTDIV